MGKKRMFVSTINIQIPMPIPIKKLFIFFGGLRITD
jgi:hypothetical protein